MDKEHFASTIDVWPTLAALLNTETPSGLPGVNLADAKAVASRTAIFGEQYRHNIADVDAPTRSLENRWIIAGDWKLIVPNPKNLPNEKPKLYKVSIDPWEKQDLDEAEPERVQRLTRQLDKWWQP